MGLLVLIVSLLLVSSVNWLAIYSALELQTLTLLILVEKGSAYSAGVGLSIYFRSGLFYLVCFIIWDGGRKGGPRGHVGLFKLCGVPFHMWAPDVYEGALMITTAVMPKIAVFSVLVQVGLVSSVLLCSGGFINNCWGDRDFKSSEDEAFIGL